MKRPVAQPFPMFLLLRPIPSTSFPSKTDNLIVLTTVKARPPHTPILRESSLKAGGCLLSIPATVCRQSCPCSFPGCSHLSRKELRYWTRSINGSRQADLQALKSRLLRVCSIFMSRWILCGCAVLARHLRFMKWCCNVCLRSAGSSISTSHPKGYRQPWIITLFAQRCKLVLSPLKSQKIGKSASIVSLFALFRHLYNLA